MSWFISVFNAILGRSDGRWGELVDRYDKRLKDVEQRLDICEERHRQRDIADSQLAKEIGQLRLAIDDCDQDRKELHARLDELDERTQ